MISAKRRKISDRDEIVEEGDLKGVTLTSDGSGKVVALSTKSCLDSERWEEMPSLSGLESLQRLDLYMNRYITSLNEESLSTLKELRVLHLTRCSRLQALPDSTGQLRNLQEVRSMDGRDSDVVRCKLHGVKRI